MPKKTASATAVSSRKPAVRALGGKKPTSHTPLGKLLEHRLTKRTRFSPKYQCIMFGNKRRIGLTSALKRAFVVPAHVKCPRTTPLLDPIAPDAQSINMSLASHLLSADELDMAADAAAERRRRRRIGPAAGAGAGADLCCLGTTDIEHGKIVDAQVTELTRRGPQAFQREYGAQGQRKPVDPCVNALFTFLLASKKWLPVASQVPIYSPSLGIGTMIDLVCTDMATHRELHVVELKATRAAICGTCRSPLAACRYREPAGTVSVRHARDLSKVVVELPASHYIQHQLQLWAMNYCLRTDFKIDATSASVVRVGGGGRHIDCFPLDANVDVYSMHLAARLRALRNWRAQEQPQQQ